MQLRSTGSILYYFFLFCRFEYLFSFEDTFEIHDDHEVLKQIRKSLSLEAGKCSSEGLKTAKSLVPKALENYVAGKVTILCICRLSRKPHVSEIFLMMSNCMRMKVLSDL